MAALQRHLPALGGPLRAQPLRVCRACVARRARPAAGCRLRALPLRAERSEAGRSTLDDSAAVLAAVERDLQRLLAFEQQNSRGIASLDQLLSPLGVKAPSQQQPVALSPAQLARVLKEKRHALDELERQADLLEQELEEKEERLRVRSASSRARRSDPASPPASTQRLALTRDGDAPSSEAEAGQPAPHTPPPPPFPLRVVAESTVADSAAAAAPLPGAPAPARGRLLPEQLRQALARQLGDSAARLALSASPYVAAPAPSRPLNPATRADSRMSDAQLVAALSKQTGGAPKALSGASPEMSSAPVVAAPPPQRYLGDALVVEGWVMKIGGDSPQRMSSPDNAARHPPPHLIIIPGAVHTVGGGDAAIEQSSPALDSRGGSDRRSATSPAPVAPPAAPRALEDAWSVAWDTASAVLQERALVDAATRSAALAAPTTPLHARHFTPAGAWRAAWALAAAAAQASIEAAAAADRAAAKEEAHKAEVALALLVAQRAAARKAARDADQAASDARRAKAVREQALYRASLPPAAQQIPLAAPMPPAEPVTAPALVARPQRHLGDALVVEGAVTMVRGDALLLEGSGLLPNTAALLTAPDNAVTHPPPLLIVIPGAVHIVGDRDAAIELSSPAQTPPAAEQTPLVAPVAAPALVPLPLLLAADAPGVRIARYGRTLASASALLSLPMDARLDVLAAMTPPSSRAALEALAWRDAAEHSATSAALAAKHASNAALSARLALLGRRIRGALLNARSVLLTDRAEAVRLASLTPTARAAHLAALPADRAAGVLGAMDARARSATMAALDAQSRAAALAAMPPGRAAVELTSMAHEARAAALAAMTPRAAAAVLRCSTAEVRAMALAWLDWEGRGAVLLAVRTPRFAVPPMHPLMAVARAALMVRLRMPRQPRRGGAPHALLQKLARALSELHRGAAEARADDAQAAARRAALCAANAARWLPFLVLKAVEAWLRASGAYA